MFEERCTTLEATSEPPFVVSNLGNLKETHLSGTVSNFGEPQITPELSLANPNAAKTADGSEDLNVYVTNSGGFHFSVVLAQFAEGKPRTDIRIGNSQNSYEKSINCSARSEELFHVDLHGTSHAMSFSSLCISCDCKWHGLNGR